MMVLWTILLTLPNSMTHSEITDRTLFSSVIASIDHSKDHSMLCLASGGSSLEWFVHDFLQGKTWQIQDDRLPGEYAKILRNKSGFVLWPVMRKKIFRLNHVGELVGTKNLMTFKGTFPDIQFVDMNAYGENEVLLAYGRGSSTSLTLALVNFEKEEITTLFHTSERDEHSGMAYWAALGRDVVFIDRASAEIRQFEMDNLQFGNILSPRKDLIESEATKHLKHLQDANTKFYLRRVGYEWRLLNLLITEQGLLYEEVDLDHFPPFSEEGRSVYSIARKTLTKQRFNEPGRFCLRKHASGSLWFDREEGMITIEPTAMSDSASTKSH